ncbi:hypothetical protein EXIGLDRAFT_746381 [Exidia glandulosa HHB12029]|uniref:CCHC-type domain-containing protein n=1 Tax=Exidia glandulosa HHB12029 TaxID=1314781 RepID=A0A165MCH7_EXIGL|nr:hypothetical protein EXIGLDRAFT_746381 [Exidia glandulosa HHB12029]
MPFGRLADSDDESAAGSASIWSPAPDDAGGADPGPSTQRRRTKQPANGFPKPHDVPSAITILRSLVDHCNARTNGGPKWWREGISERFGDCLDILESLQDVLGTLPAEAVADRVPDQYAAIAESLARITSALDRPAVAQTSPASAHTPRSTKPSRTFPLSIPLSLDAVPPNSHLLKIPSSQIKTSLDAAISKSEVLAATGSHIHSVKRDRTRLFVHAISLGQKEALVKFQDEWLPALGTGVRIAVRKIILQADLVDTRFDPTAESALDAIAVANPTTVRREHLAAVSWVHGDAVVKSGRSSLSLTVTDIAPARELIREGLCILGEHCCVNLQVPGVKQCFRCQGFGHLSSTCLKQQERRPLACGRCASAHPTSDCTCPAATKCTDMRSCTHVKVSCVNCGDSHKAFSLACPVKAKAVSAAQSSPAYVALLNELLYPPLRK